VFAFGGFQLDRRRRLLIDARGAPVHITAKAFDTLVYLLEHPGQVIDRAALLQALWPNTIVEENNLSQAVASLRRLLGDGFIVTVTGRGYQFVADVQAIDSAPVADSVTMPATRPTQSWRYVVAIAAAMTIAIAAGAYVYRTSVAPPDAIAEAGGNTLAVLPLVNLSKDREQDHFADGLTEELINRLSRIATLRVTARTSSFAFRKSERTVREIANVLGVSHVLEGSVSKAEAILRVRVQLVDAVSGHTVWSQSYDRRLHDALRLQDEIAEAVARTLVGRLGLADSVATVGGTRHAEAYALYLAAKANTRLVPEYVERGLTQVDRALSLDPQFALAWAQRSRLMNLKQVFAGGLPGDAQAAAEHAALRAIELAPTLGFAHTALAAALMTRSDRLRAESEFTRGLELGHWDDADVYGIFLISVGHLTRARDHLLTLQTRDPLNASASARLAAAYDGLGLAAAALSELERGRRLFDRWQEGLNIEVLTRLGGAGDVRAVPTLYPQLRQLWQPFVPVLDALDNPHKATAEVRARFHMAGTPQGHLLAVAAMLGQEEFAVEEFIRLVMESRGVGSSSGIFWAHVFRDMRRLPRFKDLVVADGLVDYWRTSGWPDHCRPTSDTDFTCS
jgi:TolB-like protein/DNA-binding winged helix-turn-helix (wHTH) protein